MKNIFLKLNSLSFYLTVLFTISLIGFSGIMISPENNSTQKTVETNKEKWILDTTVDGVKCYYKFTTCNSGKDTLIFLRFDNSNKKSVKISWEETFKTQKEDSVVGIQGTKQMELSKGKTKDISCDNAESLLYVHPSDANPTYPVQILNFKFTNVKVTSIQ